MLINYPPKTNKRHCPYIELIRDESPDPIPIFNSNVSLIGISVSQSGNSILGDQTNSKTKQNNQSQTALSIEVTENKSRINSTFVFLFCPR